MNLVDSSGWIAYFFETANAETFAPVIEDTERLIVPVVCLYEVFKKICLAVGESSALAAVGHMRLARTVAVSEEVAFAAALISISHKLPMADALIYATGKLEHAMVWTQDEHFVHLPGVRYIPA